MSSSGDEILGKRDADILSDALRQLFRYVAPGAEKCVHEPGGEEPRSCTKKMRHVSYEPTKLFFVGCVSLIPFYIMTPGHFTWTFPAHWRDRTFGGHRLAAAHPSATPSPAHASRRNSSTVPARYGAYPCTRINKQRATLCNAAATASNTYQYSIFSKSL